MSEPTPVPALAVPAKTSFFASINWGKVLGAATLTLIGAMIPIAYTHLTAKEPQLRYSVDDPVHFKGALTRVSVSAFSVVNEGNKSAEDVECSLRVGKAIKEIKVGPDHLNATHTVSKDGAIVIKLKRLNPTERLTVSVLSDELIDRMDVDSVRGDGVNGELQKPKSSSLLSVLFWFVSVCFAITTASSIYANVTYNRIIRTYREIIERKDELIKSLQKAA